MTAEVDMLTPCPGCGLAFVDHSLEGLAGCFLSLTWDGDDDWDGEMDRVSSGQLTLIGPTRDPAFGSWTQVHTETVDGPTLRRVL
jgi:hypothetical protein